MGIVRFALRFSSQTFNGISVQKIYFQSDVNLD
jgi:hypothetical protein